MRVFGLILGALGGLVGLVGAVIVMTAGGTNIALGRVGGSQAVMLGAIAIIFALIGIVGALYALSRPTLAGVLMIISAIGGTVAITGAYAIGGLLLLIGGISAIIGQREHERRPVRAVP